MRIKNTSRYPDDEVRRLVEFGMKGVNTNGVMVHVKNSQGAYRGRAYNGVPYVSPAYKMKSVNALITIGIGAPEQYPCDNMIRRSRWSEVSQKDYDQLPEEERRQLRHWTYSDGTHRYQRENVTRHPYGGKRSPLIEMRTWQEGLVAVAAHEARHHYQHAHGKSGSEVDAERHAAKILERFRRS